MPRLPLPRALVVCVALLAAAVPGRAAPGQSASLIVATDLLQLKQVESPVLSPDGRWVAYVLRSIEPKAENAADWVYHTHLWLAAVDGSTPPRRLTHGAASNTSPTWHPDGRRLAFVRTPAGERPQIHVLPLDGGEAQPITKLPTGASAPRWSPDGRRLLFTSSLSYAQVRAALEKSGAAAVPAWSVEKPARTANDTANWALKPAATKGAAKAESAAPPTNPPAKADADGSLAEIREWLAQNEADANPRVTTRYNFLAEGDLQTELSFTQLYVQDDREGAEARPLDLGFESKTAPEWLTDGRRIVALVNRDATQHPDRSRDQNQVILLDAETGARTVFAAADEVSYNHPTPSPDGHWIAFTVQTGGPFSFDQPKVAIQSTAGGTHRMLTASLDRAAGAPRWSADSAAIYFTAASEGAFPLYRVPLAGGDVQALTGPSRGIRDFDLAAHTLVQAVSEPANPSELHVASPSGEASRALTRHNAVWLAGKQLATYEEHTTTSASGLPLQFWTMKPTAFDPTKKYPLLLNIHGGPSAMWGPGEASMWFEFQFYAAKGYAQVFGNPRGSGGYGRDFQRANYRDWGRGPASDVLAFATEAARQPFVDPERQVITGGSYGGYLTAFVITQDHRFKAAIAQRGVYDLITFFGEGNAWFLVPLYWGGYPWESGIRELLLRDSPYTYVDQIKTPLLIKHGDVDYRTGVTQSQMLYKSLKTMGRDAEYVRYPRATHELSRSGEPKQRLDRLVRYEEFFRRYVGDN